MSGKKAIIKRVAFEKYLDKKKVDDMKLLEDTIGLEKTNSPSVTKKIIQFGA